MQSIVSKLKVVTISERDNFGCIEAVQFSTDGNVVIYSGECKRLSLWKWKEGSETIQIESGLFAFLLRHCPMIFTGSPKVQSQFQ